MAELVFPADRIVGVVDWYEPDGPPAFDPEKGPTWATGRIVVPDGVGISLRVSDVAEIRAGSDGGWRTSGGNDPVDLSFLLDLPAEALESLHLSPPLVQSSIDAVAHLAPGLRRLYLAATDLTDAALEPLATLTGLISWQSWSNRFTDDGVQVLARLTDLQSLCLEEESLGFKAFEFVDQLPQLTRLGLQDVPLSRRDLKRLQRRLPRVDVR